LSRLTISDRTRPRPPSDSPVTATTLSTGGATNSDWSNGVASGHTSSHTPVSATAAPIPLRSPSLPVINGGGPSGKAAKILRLSDLPISPAVLPGTDPGPLLPSALQRSPTTPDMQYHASSISNLSKRSHLIREIAATERAHANDLALIRDAYLLRQHLRPTSQYSVTDSAASPGNISDASRRSSVYTYQTAETKRSSGHESLNPSWSAPLTKVASGENTPYGSISGSTATMSSTSFHTTPQPSPRNGSRSSIGMPPPVGKPLSPVDTKNVFLNIDQLAAIADELATAFEGAMGVEENGPGAIAREGEAGTDRIGDVFTTLVCQASHTLLISATSTPTTVWLLLCSTKHRLCTSRRASSRSSSCSLPQ